MRRDLLTIVLACAVLGLLVLLNALFLAAPSGEEDEESGDRSSYKGTRYGTLAFYSLLQESGYRVRRFEEPYTSLGGSGVDTLFVITPKAENQPSEEEIVALGEWVRGGGRLVVIDRVMRFAFDDPPFNVETGEIAGEDVAPAGPSAFTRGVRGLRVTKYANTIEVDPPAAAVHFAAPRGPLVVDRPYGAGYVVLVAESHMVENGGIAAGDNVVFALNLAAGLGDPGNIAFDEYHHGHGTAAGPEGGLRGYIAGTPVPWLLAQLGLLGGAIALALGRRFGRAIPLARERRTSALEFVSSMANIQRLARASDLAVENIYTPFRARLCRYAGASAATPTDALATAAARLARADRERLARLMRRCEEVLAGAEVERDELVALVAEVRQFEARLGLK
jgi:hypothetical protein